MEYLATLLSATVLAVVFALLRRSAHVAAKIDGERGEAILEYRRGFKTVARILFVVPPGGVAVLWAVLRARGDDVSWLPGLLAFFLFCGGALLVEARVRLLVSDDWIVVQSPWSRARRIEWARVRRVTFSPAAQWFVIVDDSGQKARAHVFISGIPTLIEFFHRKLDSRIYSEAVRLYRARA